MIEKTIQTIPSEAGSYLLWLSWPQPKILEVGKLGSFTFPAGDYAYLGSANGPGGLRARLARHLRGEGKRHWHIDHLRAKAQVYGFGYQTNAVHFQDTLHLPPECSWSQKLAGIPRVSIPAPGFGASDCHSGCAAHLLHFPADSRQISALIADYIGINLKTIKK